MDLFKFYKDNIDKENYYYNFYDKLVTKREEQQKNLEEIFGISLNNKIEFDVFDEEEAIELFRKILQPENDYSKNDDLYLLLSFYLYKQGYIIEEFPRILERPAKSLSEFAYTTIRTKLLSLGKSRPNGEVPYIERKKYIAAMHFKKNPSLLLNVNDEINKMFKRISTRSSDFYTMKTDEQIQEISNLIENMLKKDGEFIKAEYNEIAFDYINDEQIKKYRKQTQCFRHSTDEAIEERKKFTQDQKMFLIQYGILVITIIYNLLYKDNQ